jgi:aspartate aminotransferase
MFAQRMDRLGESATVKTIEIVNKLKREGIDVIGLNVGEPDFVTPKHIMDAADKAMREGFTHYTSAPGIMELREAIADKSYDMNGIPCEASNVIVTPTKYGIMSAILAFVDMEDEVILPDPSWVTYRELIHFAGGKCIDVPVDPKTLTPKPEDLAGAITPRTKMIIITSPSNPTGGVMTKGQLKGIADLATDHNLIVLADEIYEHIVYDVKHHSIASFPDMFERTITANGFSKSYAMTGWRLGYIVLPKWMFKGINKFQQHGITCCSSFIQKAGVVALKSKKSETSIKKMLKEFKKRRDYIVPALNKLPGFKCKVPKGTFYAFPSFSQKMSSSEMANYLLEKAHVSVTPGAAFGPNGEGFLRISFANSMKNLKTAIDRMSQVLRDLPK